MKHLLCFTLLACIFLQGQSQNVGIGTSTPQSRFHIVSNVALPMRLENPSGNSSEIAFLEGATIVGYAGMYMGNMELVANSTRKLILGSIINMGITIIGNGNVGIGEPNPSTRLQITGEASISGNYMLEFGRGIAGKEVNAGKIGYGVFTPNALDIVGGGTAYVNRRIHFYNEGGAIFEGSLVLNNGEVNHNTTGTANLIPIAYGTVEGNSGAILSGTGNFSVSRIAAGHYTVTVAGQSLTPNNSATNLSIVSDGTPAFIAGNYSTGYIVVRIVSYNATDKVDRNFSFVVYQP